MASCSACDDDSSDDEVWYDAELDTGPSSGPKTSTDHFQCPICLEPYKRPRCIPNCLHSFCEQCLCSYVSSIITHKGKDTKPKCPICRLPFPTPESIDQISKWSKSLPFNHILVSLMSDAKQYDKGLCEPCRHRGMMSPAVKYCIVCTETLCTDCLAVHRSGRVSRSHVLLEIDDVAKQPLIKSKLDQFLYCPDHTEKEIEFYCFDHKSLLCSTCAVIKHKICQKVVEISEVSEQLLADSNINGMECDLTRIQNAVVERFGTMKKECDNVKNQVTNLKLKVNDIRKKFNATLDRYEERYINDAKTVLTNHGSQMTTLFNKWSKLSAGIKSSLALYEVVKKHGTKPQIFVCCQKINIQIENYVALLEEDTNSASVDIQLDISNEINILLQDNLSIGSLKITQTEINIPEINPLSTFTSKVNTLPTSLRPKQKPDNCSSKEFTIPAIERIGIFQVKTPDGLIPWFAGATFLADGRVVLTDFQNYRIILLDKSFEFQSQMELSAKPIKVAAINETEVAVTLAGRKKIWIISVTDKLQILRTLHTHLYAKAVMPLNDRQLIVSENDGDADGNWSLVTITTDGKDCVILELDGLGREFKDGYHMALDRTNEVDCRVLHSCKDTRTLYCFSMEGTPLFSYELDGPSGTDVDLRGNIYICNHFRHQIRQLSREGKFQRAIQFNDLKKPTELRFNVARDMFLVTLYKRPEIHIFKVNYRD